MNYALGLEYRVLDRVRGAKEETVFWSERSLRAGARRASKQVLKSRSNQEAIGVLRLNPL